MSKAKYQHVAARVFDTPLLIVHSKLLAILNVLGPRLGFELSEPQLKMMDDYDYAPPDPFEHMEHLQALGIELEPQGEGHFVGEGVAVIPVTGTLVQRSDWITEASGMTSYARIERMVDAAQRDARVRELLYDFDTPGGEVAGAFDFADRLYDMRTHGAKPGMSIVNELAASAGYLLASAASEDIVVNRTAGVGSIGVVAAHFDYSKAMEKRGVVVTYVYAGEKKIDGNPYQPLSESAKKEWQVEIDDVYGMFVETISRNIGMEQEKVRATQAAIYTGRKAVDARLARSVNTFANAFEMAMKRAKDPNRRSWYGASSQKESEMTKEQLEAQQRAEVEAKAKAEAEVKAKAEAEAKAKAEAEKTGKDAVAAERERCAAILALPEAKGREAAAQVAIAQGLSVEASKAILAAAPKASGLSDAMGKINQPGLSAEDPPQPAAEKPKVNPKSVYEKRRAQAEAYRG